MFAYNPTVEDRSGEILGAAQASSATTKANANVKLVSDIGSALVSLAGAYGASKMQAAGGKAFKQVMEIAGPSMGLTDEQLKMFKSMNDQDAYQAGQIMGGWAPSMISSAGYGRLALANQKAAYQNQVPANQQPVSAGGGGSAPAASPMGGVNFNFVN